MPDMGEEEAIEATKIHSIAGHLDPKQGILTTRPFRSPHHTISNAGLLGGGSNPGPGEVSLAHHGVLFLDELPEFSRSTLEVMRQPIEDRQVTISRAAGSLTFPANFMLVSAMNPCPCGYYGDPKRDCRCAPRQIEHYLEQAMTHLNFSARAYDRILKVARTLADLDNADRIGPTQVLEAIQYRSLDRNLQL